MLNKSVQAERSSVRRLVVTAVLSALSAALMYLEFSVPVVPGFLKYDFSDLPALIAAFGVGPIAGVTVELIKNLIHLPMTATGGVGELANFIIGVCYVLPAGLIYRFRKNRAGAFMGAMGGAVLASVMSLPVNYWITYPVYTNFMPMEAIIGAYSAIIPAANTLWKALLMVNLPFTFVKGLINVAVTFALYKRISPLLHGTGRRAGRG
jgi:riboflavin transporter